LGGHSYDGPGLWERNGIVYTCRGGHIDITHLRKVADWTAWLAWQIEVAIRANRTDFSFRMLEPSRFHVRIEYPEDWRQLAPGTRDATATEIAIELGSYLAFTASTWHEILTWFGYKGAGFYPEYVSAFSWEDCYSNALGSRIGAAALRDPDHEFNQAMTLLLSQELTHLEVQPRPAAWVAGKAVHGKWFTGNYWWYHMVRRNFDIGLDDGSITPWLVPGMTDCHAPQPADCPAPTSSSLRQHGFAVRLEIEPREWEKGKILAIVYPDGWKGRIEPARHFGPIMEYIRAQAVQRFGPNAGSPGAMLPRQPRNTPNWPTVPARWLRAEASESRARDRRSPDWLLHTVEDQGKRGMLECWARRPIPPPTIPLFQSSCPLPLVPGLVLFPGTNRLLPPAGNVRSDSSQPRNGTAPPSFAPEPPLVFSLFSALWAKHARTRRATNAMSLADKCTRRVKP
jgi:hypothetical protein